MSLFGIHSFANDVLLESGQGKGEGFNGWFINPYELFSGTYFHDDYVEFLSDQGGEISIELIRKIPSMSDFEEILVEFRFHEVANSRLNSVSIYDL